MIISRSHIRRLSTMARLHFDCDEEARLSFIMKCERNQARLTENMIVAKKDGKQ